MCVSAAVSVLFAVAVFALQKQRHFATLSVLLMLVLCVRQQLLVGREAVDSVLARASVNEKGREQTERTKGTERKAHESAQHQNVYAHANAKGAVTVLDLAGQ